MKDYYIQQVGCFPLWFFRKHELNRNYLYFLNSPAVIWANQTKLNEIDDWFSWAPRAFHYPSGRKDISQKLKDFYFGTQAEHLNFRNFIQNLTNLYGDRLFNFGIVQSAIHEMKHNVPMHLYVYGHEGGFNMGTLIAASQSTIHPVFAILAERLRFLFATYVLGQEYKQDVPGQFCLWKIYYIS